MSRNSVMLLASAMTLWTGLFGGAYWLPVGVLAAMGLLGAWGTLAITLVAVAALFPFALASRRGLAAE